MPRLCEVCSKENSKYKCPTCGLASCSLGCTKLHKVYCAPKQSPATAQSAVGNEQQQPGLSSRTPSKKEEQEEEEEEKEKDSSSQPTKDLNNSPAEYQKLFAEYPGLRAKLRDIYKTTQEEEWETSASPSTPHRRDRSNRGVWTAEKGFNRGVGKVRKWREACERGECTGPDAEGFTKFVGLVVGEVSPRQNIQ